MIFCEAETIARHRRLFDCWVTMFLLALLLSTGSASAQGANPRLLTTFNNPSLPGNNFGNSVAAVGSDRIIIGANVENTGAEFAGAAYLFDTSGMLLTTFTNPTPADYESFGRSVAAKGGDRVLIGTPYEKSASTACTGREQGAADVSYD